MDNLVNDHMISYRHNLPESWQEAIIAVDKQGGMTSFDVIRTLRRNLGIKKIGHAGTLDPMATGLLICLVGKATKRQNEFLEQTKIYSGIIRLGETTPSFDAETEIVQTKSIKGVKQSDIVDVCRSFVGTIVQSTPMYSAVKVGGERLYRKARRGEVVKTPLRVVTIGSFDVSDLQGSDLDFTMRCSKGTYVRTIANDLGEKLGVGAHLIKLRRTGIGEVSVEDAWSLDALVSRIQEAKEGTG